ncbi:MAG: MBL fold metallo-hydrolase [Oscillospiraceae bacterium]|nr:MBL fold metallo-hydrolase [Oscillospiraceae bacterium]
MTDKLRVSVLCDNIESGGAKSEHGFALLFERGENSLLLDTGSTRLFISNAAALGRDLGRLKAVALSHNHFDHTGGLIALLDEYKDIRPRVYISPHFYKQSGWRREDEEGLIMPTSSPLSPELLCRLRARVRYVEAPLLPVPEFEGAYILTNIERSVDFETIDESDLIYREDKWIPDDYRDEIALAFETEGGLVVATGCAHTGACNIIECARRRLGREVLAAIGGTHLVAHGPERAELTAAWLREKGPKRFIACHCTGEEGFRALESAGFSRGFCGFCAEF